MATIAHTFPTMPTTRDYHGVSVVSWTPLAGTDVGSAVELPRLSDRTVQILGTFDSATVVLQGSLNGTDWVTLTDPQGNAISKTAAAIEAVTEVVRFIRPSLSGGLGSCAVTVLLLAKG